MKAISSAESGVLRTTSATQVMKRHTAATQRNSIAILLIELVLLRDAPAQQAGNHLATRQIPALKLSCGCRVVAGVQIRQQRAAGKVAAADVENEVN